MQQAWPSNPTMPSAAPAGYVTPVQPDPTRSEPPLSSAQLEAQRQNFYELLLKQVVLAFVGFFVPGLSSFEQLQTWADSVGLGDLLEILTGIPDADNNDLGSWVNNLLHRSSGAVPILSPAASVVDVHPNLLMNGNFTSPSSIVAQQGWSHDITNGRTTPGSGLVVADGTLNELVTNQIPVVEGQKMDLSIFVEWTGVTFTGSNPIAMGVTRYMDGEEVGSSDEAFIASPPSTSSWVELSKLAYEVPAGCDEIRLRLKIGANLTTGNVWWDDGSVYKTDLVKDAVVPGVTTIIDNIVNGLQNSNGSAWGHADSFAAMLNQLVSTIGLGTRVQYLESLQTTGIRAIDDFERVSVVDLGSDWDLTYFGPGAGTWATPNGHDASWAEGFLSYVNRGFLARFIGTGSVSNTDLQKVTCVLGSFAESNGFAGVSGRNDLIGRMSSDNQNYVRASFRPTGLITITAVVAGVETLLGSTTVPAAGAGTALGFLIGSATNNRHFAATLNGQIVLEFDEVGTTSQIGAGFRGWGHGGLAEGAFFAGGQMDPGRLNSWAAIDQT
jgi:hypothetical protein